MRGINRVTLIGTLGRDPESKSFPNGGMVTNCSIATNEEWLDKHSGQPRKNTEWHRLVFNNRLAEIAIQYLKKGSTIYVEGKLKTRKWTDGNGVDHYTTEVSVFELQMLGPPQAKPQAPRALPEEAFMEEGSHDYENELNYEPLAHTDDIPHVIEQQVTNASTGTKPAYVPGAKSAPVKGETAAAKKARLAEEAKKIVQAGHKANDLDDLPF